MMTNRQKLNLIKRVHKKAFDAFESFRKDNIGTGLAYLYAAIAFDGTYQCLGESEDAVFEEWLWYAAQTTWGRALNRFVSFKKEVDANQP